MIPDQTRRVLLELSEALPSEGHNVLTGVDMRTGWGETIFVTLRSRIPRHENRHEVEARYKRAVAAALGAARHQIQVKWDQ
jgi:predicted secreted Zn-dependent protease